MTKQELKLEKMKNKSMETLKKQNWTAFIKALVNEQIKRNESLIVNGHIIYLEDMIEIREEQISRINFG